MLVRRVEMVADESAFRRALVCVFGAGERGERRAKAVFGAWTVEPLEGADGSVLSFEFLPSIPAQASFNVIVGLFESIRREETKILMGKRSRQMSVAKATAKTAGKTADAGEGKPNG